MKCFYHSADLDGHCAGAIVKMKYPECKMIGINYGEEFPWDDISPKEEIWMVDFCLQPFSEMMKLRLSCCRLLVWIDHHETAIEEKGESFFYGNQQIGLGACEITWKYVFNLPVPRAVRLLSMYDVWDHSDPDTLPFQYGFRLNFDTRPENQELWSGFFYDDAQLVGETIEEGKIILQYEKRQNEKFCRAYSFEGDFHGLRAIIANKGFSNSMLFDSVYDPQKHDLMISFCRLPLQKWTVSLYSTTVDVGEIAKKYGGGGHKGSAGFQCDVLPKF